MPTDLHDLARRLVALGYDMDDDGIRLVEGDPQNRHYGHGFFVGDTQHAKSDLCDPLPDLSHDGTLGVLLGAMGWPMLLSCTHCNGFWYVHIAGDYKVIRTEGPTRQHAIAAAIVALAESRGGVVP